MIDTNELIKYEKHFSNSSLFDKLKRKAKKASLKTVYVALLLFYTLIDGNVSFKDKSLIIGALGYFILPLDFIPDMMLPVGYADDVAMLFFVIGKIRNSITPEIKQQARKKLQDYFSITDERLLDTIC
jgi:uncharacterized membrane protein YkvA (DUF1232 family)